MSNLLEQTRDLHAEQASDDASRLAEANAVYLALLRRADNPEPGDAEVLADLMADLGLTEGAVANHLSAIKKFRRFTERHTELPEAQAEARRLRDELREMQARHKKEEREAGLASLSANTQSSVCAKAMSEAQALARTVPMLFEEVPGGFPMLRGEAEAD